MSPKELAEQRLFPILVIISFLGIVVSLFDSATKLVSLFQQNYYLILSLLFVCCIVFTYYTKFNSRKWKNLIIIITTLLFCTAILLRYYEVKIKATSPAQQPDVVLAAPPLWLYVSREAPPTFTIEEFYLNEELCSFTESQEFKFAIGPKKFRTFAYNHDVNTAFQKGQCYGVEGNRPIDKVLPILKKRLDAIDRPQLKSYISTSADLSRVIMERGDIFKQLIPTDSEIAEMKKNAPADFEIFRNWLVKCVGIKSPVITFILQNKTDKPVIISKVEYEVQEVGQVMGGESALLYPVYTYNHILHHTTGKQDHQLNPALKLTANDQLAFNIRLIPFEKEPGLCWFLRIRIFDSAGNAQVTEPVQIIMSK